MSVLCELYFWGIYCEMGLYFVTCLDAKHITWHMVPLFLYDQAKSALPGTSLPSNPSWITVLAYNLWGNKKNIYLGMILLWSGGITHVYDI